MFGGKTVEVLNTDAEGRLVLADGISTANEDKPDLIIDVATLTGACVVALGRNTSGVFSNDEDLQRELPAVAERAGEQMWAMPIPEEMHDKVRTTKIADLSQHNPEPWGGALYAAAFLREFVAGRHPVGAPRHRRPGLQRGLAQRLYAQGRDRVRPCAPSSSSPSSAPADHLTTIRADPTDRRPIRRAIRPIRQTGSEPTLDGVIPLGSTADQNHGGSDRGVARRMAVRFHSRIRVGIADDGGVVARNSLTVGEVVRPADGGHPAPGPLAVDRDQQQGRVRDGGARLDEALDAGAGLDPLLQVAGVVGLGARSTPGRATAGPEPMRPSARSIDRVQYPARAVPPVQRACAGRWRRQTGCDDGRPSPVRCDDRPGR